MCRLVGWVSSTPMTPAEVLGEDGLAALVELSRRHEDGWGIAWWAGDRLAVRTSHQAAYRSEDFHVDAREVRSDAALVHLRWATPGLPVSPENTHPFLTGEWAFGHNGAVRPADGLLGLLSPEEATALRGTTDSERLMHVLLARIRRSGLDEGLRATVRDVCAELTPTSLNALLLGPESMTAVCSHGAPAADPAVPAQGPPEDLPGYFDLRWQQRPGLVVVSSEPLGDGDWTRLPNGSALVATRGTVRSRVLPVGDFPAAALERERLRRSSAVDVSAS